MSSLNSIELQKLYIAFFGRPCDPSGLNYWLSKINEKVNLIDIAKSLSIQAEYKQNLTSNSIEFQINQLYSNLFARKADFESLNYWSEKLKKDELHIYNLAFILTHHQENSNQQNNNISLEDFQVLEKKN